eukprot:scaffold73275_cov21-Tisochrysis_lutea.AAC.3
MLSCLLISSCIRSTRLCCLACSYHLAYAAHARVVLLAHIILHTQHTPMLSCLLMLSCKCSTCQKNPHVCVSKQIGWVEHYFLSGQCPMSASTPGPLLRTSCLPYVLRRQGPCAASAPGHLHYTSYLNRPSVSNANVQPLIQNYNHFHHLLPFPLALVLIANNSSTHTLPQHPALTFPLQSAASCWACPGCPPAHVRSSWAAGPASHDPPHMPLGSTPCRAQCPEMLISTTGHR